MLTLCIYVLLRYCYKTNVQRTVDVTANELKSSSLISRSIAPMESFSVSRGSKVNSAYGGRHVEPVRSRRSYSIFLKISS